MSNANPNRILAPDKKIPFKNKVKVPIFKYANFAERQHVLSQ